MPDGNPGEVWILVNAASGKGSAPARAATLARTLKSMDIRSRIICTSDSAQGSATVRRAVEEAARAVIACGGDGTVHSIHAPLVDTRIPLGILPSGSGDDIAGCLGFTDDVELLASRVLADPVSIDVGAITTDAGVNETFLGIMSSGFDSAVNQRANRLPRLAGQRYNIAMLQELASFKPIAYRVEVDGIVHEVVGMLIAIGNGDRYGGGMLVCPGARMNDGLLSITILGAMGRSRFVRLFPRVYRGTHVEHPSVTTLEGRSIRIWADGPVAFADGEYVGPLPVNVGVRPHALRVLGPVQG